MKKLIAGMFLLTATCGAQQYTKDGELVPPKDYRQWVFLSSGIGMTYSNAPTDRPLFDNVFVNPTAFKQFLKTGTWPDKTVLVKENRVSDSHASNKNGRFQANLVASEAHVKDAKRGGWVFYVFGKNGQSGKPLPRTTACYSCHEKNAATDTTFVQFYPTLIDTAREKGTYKDTGDVLK